MLTAHHGHPKSIAAVTCTGFADGEDAGRAASINENVRKNPNEKGGFDSKI